MPLDEVETTPLAGKPIDNPTPVRKILRNAVWSSGSWGVTALLTLLATPFFVQRLTFEGYGIYALLTGLVGYYGLLDLGLGQGVIQSVAESSVRGNREGISSAINAALWVQISTGLIGSMALIVFSDPLLRLLHVSPVFWSDSKVGLYASAVGFFVTMISGTLSSVLMGLQRFDITGAVNASSSMLLTVATVVTLYLGGGLRQVLFVTAGLALAVFLVYFWAVRRLLRGWRFSFRVDRRQLHRLFSFSGYLFVSRSASLFSTYIVRFIIASILGPAAVTLYVVCWRLISGFGGLLSSAFGVLFPYASELGAQEDRGRVRRIYVEASRFFASISIPVYLALSVFAEQILTVWMGKGFAEEAWPVLSLLSLGALLGSLSTVPNLISMGLGYSKPIGLFSIASVAFYAVLLPLCTRRWGIVGSAWGMLWALAPALALVVFETERIIGLRTWNYLRSVLAFHVIPMGVSFLLMDWIRTMTGMPASWMLAIALILLTVYLYLMLATGWVPWRKLAARLAGKE